MQAHKVNRMFSQILDDMSGGERPPLSQSNHSNDESKESHGPRPPSLDPAKKAKKGVFIFPDYQDENFLKKQLKMMDPNYVDSSDEYG